MLRFLNNYVIHAETIIKRVYKIQAKTDCTVLKVNARIIISVNKQGQKRC